jgi:hypothetical protein
MTVDGKDDEVVSTGDVKNPPSEGKQEGVKEKEDSIAKHLRFLSDKTCSWFFFVSRCLQSFALQFEDFILLWFCGRNIKE